jgi:hypothetical protein
MMRGRIKESSEEEKNLKNRSKTRRIKNKF